MKKVKRTLISLLLIVLLLSTSIPTSAATKSYKHVYRYQGDKAAFGLTDTISYVITDGKITSVLVYQSSHSWFEYFVQAKPEGYYFVKPNVIATKWSIVTPFKIKWLNLDFRYWSLVTKTTIKSDGRASSVTEGKKYY